MNKNAKGIVFYLVGILIIVLLVLTFRDRLEESQTWNSRELEESLNRGEVVQVQITPNKEVPTGVLRVVLATGEIKYVNVTDVRAAENELKGYSDVSVEVNDVMRDSVFLTSILPVLLMGGGTTVLFVSHSLGQIREMCDRVLWLDHGQMKMLGGTQAVCDAYEGE